MSEINLDAIDLDDCFALFESGKGYIILSNGSIEQIVYLK